MVTVRIPIDSFFSSRIWFSLVENVRALASSKEEMFGKSRRRAGVLIMISSAIPIYVCKASARVDRLTLRTRPGMAGK